MESPETDGPAAPTRRTMLFGVLGAAALAATGQALLTPAAAAAAVVEGGYCVGD